MTDMPSGSAGALAGTRIIVTGATYGLGAGTVVALAQAGARVAAMGRSVVLGEQVATAASARGPGEVRFIACDVADRAQVRSAFAAAADWLGTVDVLFNAAGIGEVEPAEDASDDSWDRQFATNARGTFHTNQEAFAYMRDRGGRIVNFGSHSGIAGTAMNAVYAASKGAVVAWSRSIALAWARYGITVNIVAPAIRTPMYEAYLATLSSDDLRHHDAAMMAQIPLGGRLGDAGRDFAPVMVFLAGSGARFITGQTIAVDGGLLMVR